ncbi:MAG: TetR/AcrR family transcriptional regulator [Elusimicrobia bacterium]|nr:TetR/AcrR family transcriptional regulator [Elusimicrobiota bacterium]
MGRPRSFDADAVLDKAVETFRAKGYEAASIEDLEKATGLRRASLYGAFHDKHSLYLAALRRYDATRAVRMIAELDAQPTGRRALERLFELVVAQCAADPSGCLIANAAMERGNSDAGAARCIGDNRRRVEGALHAAVLRGRADGSLKGRGDAGAKARLLFSVVLGLRALAKSGCTRAQLKEVSDLALETV